MSSSESEAKSTETEIFIGHPTVPKTVPGHRCRMLLLSALVSMVVALLVSICSSLLLLPRYKTRPVCLARSVPMSADKNSWNWTMENCNDHFRIGDQKLEILKQGVYVIYIHVTHKPMGNGPYNDTFTVQLRKESNGGKGILHKMTEYVNGIKCDSCQPYISMAHPYQLQKGERLYLEFNALSNIDIDMTFWGVYELAPITVSLSALFQESA
ncbi:hypothetical protein NDU88_004109 [Pleurodeles waltl]|uniref:THD domain-containing protein n=1 Tax=Pleurodeles waltl TaxID=8319 RepID=A0AAV7T8S5_PLEWA|nr:hypothetical protein NDU88_004109 [Pleurodeles waltl]